MRRVSPRRFAACVLVLLFPAMSESAPERPPSEENAVLAGRTSAPAAALPHAADASDFIAHLEVLAPRALERTDATGLGIALIRRGEAVWSGAFGAADPATGERVTATTLFNVGSIAKTLTAWGVMKLVEEGELELDAPVAELLPRWPLAGGEGARPGEPEVGEASGITVRRLLAHTAGLSMGATPETPPDATPDLAELLADSLRRVARPGAEWRYSGGGYGLLELLIEARTGRAFAEYMNEEILEPLGMRRSFFGWRPELPALAATPMDGGAPTAYRDYPVLAAAGLWTTLDDLARFGAAWLGTAATPRGGGVLRPATVDSMTAPAPETEQRWGIRYGLGTNLWPTTDGRFAAGHAGQNTGWAAALWTLPGTGDGIVLLTNASDGADAYRWPLCDWVGWAADASWGAYCADRTAGPRGTLDPFPAQGGGSSPRLPRVDSLLRARFAADRPGVAVAIRRGDSVLHAAGYGMADLATGAPIEAGTPFYLASLTKPWTALLVARLVARERLSWESRLGDLVPELPAFADVTVRQLLTHTAGIPDYYRFIDWSRFRGLDDAAVLDTLRAHPEPEFAPGTRFSYSNSNYALLAEIVAHVEGRPFAEVFEDVFVTPLGLRSTSVGLPPGGRTPRAVGYAVDEGTTRVSDWNAIELPFGPVVEYALTTSGAGGGFSSVADLLRLERAMARGGLVDSATVGSLTADPVPAPDLEGPGDRQRYGFGWAVGRAEDHEVVWHDGNFAGFSTALLRVPELDLAIAVLSNVAGHGALELAEELLGVVTSDADRTSG